MHSIILCTWYNNHHHQTKRPAHPKAGFAGLYLVLPSVNGSQTTYFNSFSSRKRASSTLQHTYHLPAYFSAGSRRYPLSICLFYSGNIIREHLRFAKKNLSVLQIFFIIKRDRTFESKDNNTFPGNSANVCVKTFYSLSGQAHYYLLQERPSFFEQLDPDSLDQPAPFRLVSRTGKLLFRRGQDPLESNNHHVANDMRPGLFGPAAHVFFLKLDQGFANVSL
jgi:hypothetical protein